MVRQALWSSPGAWTLFRYMQIIELAAREEFKMHFSPYFTGWIFGVAAFVYIRNRYEGSKSQI